MRQGTKLSDSQIFHFLSQWRVKSDEGVLMALLFPMSQTFINWGNTSNLVWEAGCQPSLWPQNPNSTPVWRVLGAATPPTLFSAPHRTSQLTREDNQEITSITSSLSVNCLSLIFFFLSLPKFPACMYAFEAEWWFLRINLMMQFPCLTAPSSHLLGPVWTSSFGV